MKNESVNRLTQNVAQPSDLIYRLLFLIPVIALSTFQEDLVAYAHATWIPKDIAIPDEL